MAREVVGLTSPLYKQGNTLTVKWVAEHRGITGNKVADPYAREELPKGEPPSGGEDNISGSFLERQAAERATQDWEKDTAERNRC